MALPQNQDINFVEAFIYQRPTKTTQTITPRTRSPRLQPQNRYNLMFGWVISRATGDNDDGEYIPFYKITHQKIGTAIGTSTATSFHYFPTASSVEDYLIEWIEREQGTKTENTEVFKTIVLQLIMHNPELGERFGYKARLFKVRS